MGKYSLNRTHRLNPVYTHHQIKYCQLQQFDTLGIILTMTTKAGNTWGLE